jgi:predicted cupin superfamily sugar epimerase
MRCMCVACEHASIVGWREHYALQPMHDAESIVKALGMRPHPEGGWYVEIHRSALRVEPVGDSGAAPTREPGARGTRAAMTSIYYLLARGQRSHWHRVDADELWAWHAGAPMELSVAHAHSIAVHRLGMDLAAGERPQAVVPAHAWQSAQPLGEWSLIGCVVAPGFEFAHFEMAPPGWSPHTRT